MTAELTANGPGDPMDTYRDWLADTHARDIAERQGPVLVGEWDPRASAAGWPPSQEAPV